MVTNNMFFNKRKGEWICDKIIIYYENLTFTIKITNAYFCNNCNILIHADIP